MIGQERVRDILGSYITNNSLPHFLILVGAKGQGKQTLANALASKMRALVYIPEDMKVDAVRAIVADSVTLHTPKFYLLADAGTMTVQAQNALLKLAEEPPKNAYIILTVEQADELLSTIQSRALIIRLEGYSEADMLEFTDDPILLSVCDNPGQVLEYEQIDYKSLYNHCVKVANNLHKISVANAFNILKSVVPDQYELFIKFLIKVLRDNLVAEEGVTPNFKMINNLLIRVYEAKSFMSNKSVNKTNLLEMMLVEMRDIAWQLA